MKLYQRLLLSALATETAFTAGIWAEVVTDDHIALYTYILESTKDDPATIAHIQRHNDRKTLLEERVLQTLRSQAIDTLPSDPAALQAAAERIAAAIANTPAGHTISDALHRSSPDVDISGIELATENQESEETVTSIINDFISSTVANILDAARKEKVLVQDVTEEDLHSSVVQVSEAKADDITKVTHSVPSGEEPDLPTIPTPGTNTINNPEQLPTLPSTGGSSATQPAGTPPQSDTAQGATPPPPPSNSNSSPDTTDTSTGSTDNSSTTPTDEASITSLTYTGQDLSLYTSLTHIIIPVSQLNSQITTTRKLHVTITGGAGGAAISLANLNFDISTLDLSGVNNVLNDHVDLTTYTGTVDTVSLTGGTLTSITAPDTLTSVTASNNQLKTIALKGNTATDLSGLSWITNATLTGADTTLDLTQATALTSLNISGNADISHLIATETITTATLNTSQIKSITFSGDTVTAIPAWVTTNAAYISGATLDVSGLSNLSGTDLNLATLANLGEVIVPSTITGTLTLPVNVTTLTADPTLNTLVAGDALTTVNGPTSLASVSLSGSSATTVPAWLLTNSNYTAASATLNISGMTNAGFTTVDLTNNTNITNVTLPTVVTTLTTPDAVTVTGGGGLTSITLQGNSAIPTWATDGARTAANATLNLENMTGLGANMDLSAFDPDITSVVLPATATTLTSKDTIAISGAGNLNSITINGNSATNISGQLAWLSNNVITNGATTLDLRGITSLTSPLDLSGISSDITTVLVSNIANLTLPSTVSTLTADTTLTTLTAGNTLATVNGPNALTSITLSGTTGTIPVWATDGSTTAAGTSLDLSGMPNIVAANLTAADHITRLTVPYGINWTGNKIEFAGTHGGNVTLALVGAGADPVAVNIVGTNPDKITTLDLTGLTGLPAAPTIDHVTDINASVTAIDLTGTGVNDATNIVVNAGNTTITLDDGVATVTK